MKMSISRIVVIILATLTTFFLVTGIAGAETNWKCEIISPSDDEQRIGFFSRKRDSLEVAVPLVVKSNAPQVGVYWSPNGEEPLWLLATLPTKRGMMSTIIEYRDDQSGTKKRYRANTEGERRIEVVPMDNQGNRLGTAKDEAVFKIAYRDPYLERSPSAKGDDYSGGHLLLVTALGSALVGLGLWHKKRRAGGNGHGHGHGPAQAQAPAPPRPTLTIELLTPEPCIAGNLVHIRVTPDDPSGTTELAPIKMPAWLRPVGNGGYEGIAETTGPGTTTEVFEIVRRAVPGPVEVSRGCKTFTIKRPTMNYAPNIEVKVEEDTVVSATADLEEIEHVVVNLDNGHPKPHWVDANQITGALIIAPPHDEPPGWLNLLIAASNRHDTVFAKCAVQIKANPESAAKRAAEQAAATQAAASPPTPPLPPPPDPYNVAWAEEAWAAAPGDEVTIPLKLTGEAWDKVKKVEVGPVPTLGLDWHEWAKNRPVPFLKGVAVKGSGEIFASVTFSNDEVRTASVKIAFQPAASTPPPQQRQ